MKQKTPPAGPVPDVPEELRIGPCMEIWGDPPGDFLSTWANWSDAARAWRAALPAELAFKVLPDRGPWSAASPGGEARLRNLDVEALRAAAAGHPRRRRE